MTFAEWEVDYVKFDGCNSDPKTMDVGFPQFGAALAATGVGLRIVMITIRPQPLCRETYGVPM